MTENVKTALIIGSVAIVGWLIYQKVTAPSLKKSPLANSGTGNNVTASTSSGTTGSADFWSSLGNVGQGLNSAVSSVESTYNGVYDLFGGQSSTASTGQGNNGTGG